MKMLCISTFNEFGKLKHLSLNRVYECKFHKKNKLFIVDDSKKGNFYPKNNFINYEIFESIKK